MYWSDKLINNNNKYNEYNYNPAVITFQCNFASLVTVKNPIFQGFILHYEEKSLGCGGTVHMSSEIQTHEISTPNYPNHPHPHSECVWIIMGPYDKELMLQFKGDFDINERLVFRK